jgi:hypothetical protein
MLVRAADSNIDMKIRKIVGLGLGNTILVWRYSKSKGLRRREISVNHTQLPGCQEASANVNRCLACRVVLIDAQAKPGACVAFNC